MLNFIHSRLGFGARLGMISALFCVPIVLLLSFYVYGASRQIQSTGLEAQGAEYARQVWDATMNGGTAPSANGRFGEEEQYRAYVAAKDPLARLSAAADLMMQVSDGSNLQGDPDLDANWIANATTASLPRLYAATADLRASFDSQDLLRIMRDLDHLYSNAGDTEAALQRAMNANAGATRQALGDKATALSQAVDAVRASLAQPATPAPNASAAISDLEAKTNAALAASSVELTRLLKARSDGLTQQMALSLAIVFGALAISGGLSFVVARGLSVRIRELVRSMEKLGANDTDAVIPYAEDRNETGRIAAALEVFKAGIIERNRLQAEAKTFHEAQEQKLSQVETAFRESGQAQTAVVRALADGLASLSERDLTVRLTDEVPAEYEQLKHDFNDAVVRLQEAITAVSAATEGLRTGAEEIAIASDDLSRRTEQQAASLEETAAALDQITATVKKTAQGAKQASEAVSVAKGVAETSGDVVRKAVTSMGEIERSSQQISQIIGVIDEIAFQTNLLALNAGVEAARAGDAGRGFAVVAQEVRALAQRSAEAAKEIKSLISTSSQQVGQGVGLVAQTGKALETIVAHVGEIDALVSQISASAQEQSTSLSEVNTAVNQMDQVVQQNAAMVEQSTAASHSLKGETNELVRLVSEFRTGGSTIHKAVAPRAATPQSSSAPSPARALVRKVAASFGASAAATNEAGWEEF